MDWGTMLEAYHKLHPKPKSITELETLQVLWRSVSQELIKKAVESFTLRLRTCTKAGSDQFERTK